MTPPGLGDIELHDDELDVAISLETVRCRCNLLELSQRQVLKMPVGDAMHFLDEQRPGEVMMIRREQCGYSQPDLAEKVGFHEATIKSLEAVPSFGNTLPIFLLKDIEVEL